MGEDCTGISCFRATLALASGAVEGDSRNDELAPCPDDDDGNAWDFADVPVEFHVNVRGSLLRDFGVI